MKRVLLALIAFIVLPAFAQPAGVALIPRADIFGNPTKTQGQLSPDGKWVSWIAPRDGVLNIWVAPVGDPSKARPLTEEKVRPIRQHFWARNSKVVLFINDRGGDENFLLYGVSPEGGEIKKYTPFEKTRVLQVRSSRKYPDEILIGVNNRKQQYHDVHRLNLATGELKLVYENNEFSGFIADEDLRLRFATREKPGGAQEILRFEDGKTSPFAEIPAEDSITTDVLGILPDGKTMYLLDSRGRDKAALVEMDLDSKATRVLGRNDKADVRQVLLNPKTRVVEAYSANYLKAEWFPVGDALKADIAALNGAIKGEWNVPSRNDDDTLWVVSADEVTKPITYYLYDRKAKKLQPLFVTRPALEGKPLAPMYGVEIRTRDGLILPSFLTLPLGASKGGPKPDKPLPMVLNVHGGPWAQDTFGYNSEAQWLANRGYAVLQVNYRGSTGFGKKFVEAANREFGGKMHDDLIDAVQWAVAQGANDPRVTQKESDSIAREMEAKKIPVTYVLYADEGHGFARPENRVSFYAISEAFLSKCLGGRIEPMAAFPGAKVTVPHGVDFVPGLAQALQAK